MVIDGRREVVVVLKKYTHTRAKFTVHRAIDIVIKTKNKKYCAAYIVALRVHSSRPRLCRSAGRIIQIRR